ncbi:carboxynorspermidine decarboxylase [Pseudoflavonifractor phocaeensis]|uniref:carboxynorspermidine decarboxylase n=1 Tax=Pseudoflavonifractor phocaeensis TaxID=1870988 RepID=UPI00195B0D3D|nr:carboxynorspermidine decarboxylase [Pseudoflavonifractor phocaeensis]MBM6926690.1 carboxynorspermidine decarboxylase [Pseudoflavonifractor phocaeensis]
MEFRGQMQTPCHILDLDRLERNLASIERLKQAADCNVLLAIKGFSAAAFFPELRRTLDGVAASGLYEARLGREQFGKMVQTFSPAFTHQNIGDILRYSDRLVWNSLAQMHTFGPLAARHSKPCALRINPQCSRGLPAAIDPCAPNSRLGVPLEQLEHADLSLVSGLHLHTMCEQQADMLEQTVDHLIAHWDPILRRCQWLNLGGGQLLCHDGYDLKRAIACLNKLHRRYDLELYLEPCEGIFVDAGYFATTVVDLVDNGMPTAILDSSAVCHFPDAPYRGWEREIVGADGPDCPYEYMLAGPTCYSGDLFGKYTFSAPLQVGDVLYFRDTATYSMVKSNLFNGVPLPSLYAYRHGGALELRQHYDYRTYYQMMAGQS